MSACCLLGRMKSWRQEDKKLVTETLLEGWGNVRVSLYSYDTFSYIQAGSVGFTVNSKHYVRAVPDETYDCILREIPKQN